ncbi:MAG: hypothetical protein ABIT05_01180 [Chitinophagaceae bacterium]
MSSSAAIPAMAYIRPIRQWAEANNIPFFTWTQMKKAMVKYESVIAKLN